ncbi:hypothetical protein B0O99DRAFT_675902 [Bisporella sp. PMI_857]|nr:hypothetical protein B0O99DRAFT_675902 [Bisporella sp. PMI_857]
MQMETSPTATVGGDRGTERATALMAPRRLQPIVERTVIYLGPLNVVYFLYDISSFVFSPLLYQREVMTKIKKRDLTGILLDEYQDSERETVLVKKSRIKKSHSLYQRPHNSSPPTNSLGFPTMMTPPLIRNSSRRNSNKDNTNHSYYFSTWNYVRPRLIP